MTTHRIFVEKRPEFRVEADSLRSELNTTLGLDIKDLRLVCVYDLFGFSDALLDKTRYGVFGETATDTVTDSIDLEGLPHLAVEALPGQFDQRASAARECVRLAEPEADVEILSARLYIFDKGVGPAEMEKISRYLINAVESRRKNLDVLALPERAHAKPVDTLAGFREITPEQAPAYCREAGLAMNGDDLMEVVRYFTAEGRDPNETELRILDTYWSDHCRHTTFTSRLTDIDVEESYIAPEIRESIGLWNKMRADLGRGDEAVAIWSELAADTDDLTGTKSAYYLARYHYDTKNTDKALEEINRLIDANPPHDYWLARGFILLSDILRRKGSDFEADEYLRSLRENYPGSETDIFQMIDSRLDR